MKHYCDYSYPDGKPCYMTYPCSLHPEPEPIITTPGIPFGTIISNGASKVKTTETIKAVYVIPLPCSHNYPQ